MKRPNYQTMEINIANAKLADGVTEGVLLAPDKEFPWITGVWVEVITLPGANTYVKVGVSDGNSGVHIQPVPSKLLNVDQGQGFDKKFTPVMIKNDGRTIKVQVVNPVLTTDALGKIIVVFRFEETDERRTPVNY